MRSERSRKRNLLLNAGILSAAMAGGGTAQAEGFTVNIGSDAPSPYTCQTLLVEPANLGPAREIEACVSSRLGPGDKIALKETYVPVDQNGGAIPILQVMGVEHPDHSVTPASGTVRRNTPVFTPPRLTR